MKDEMGKPIKEMRGLYCSNCHNQLAHELYKLDDLTNVATQEGKTLRNKSIAEVKKTAAGGDEKKFKTFFADPIVGAEGYPLSSFYGKHAGATLVRASKDSAGKLKLLAWNAKEGDPVPYDGASGGKDWWLAAGEPHCADCHLAPFVESEGGTYFPIDQPNKYSLYRYSKAHGTIACQSCHRVNAKGVPVQLEGTEYYNDYWASVALPHYMRTGDEKLPINKLMEKFPHKKSAEGRCRRMGIKTHEVKSIAPRLRGYFIA
jgi:mono/diheme cytochrome c family protein